MGIEKERPAFVPGGFLKNRTQLPSTIESGIDLLAALEQGDIVFLDGLIYTAREGVYRRVLEEGFDLASGLHNLLRNERDLVEVAKACGRNLHDVRIPQVEYPIASGEKRTGKRVLAVGTDCSVGKMYTTLALDAAMRERGMKSTFRATGQTGILITGEGVPLDAVIADFMAGSIEYLTPDNDADHWDVIEGQGGLPSQQRLPTLLG